MMTESDTTPSFDVATTLGSVFDGRTLSRDEARAVMGRLMDGELSQMQAAASNEMASSSAMVCPSSATAYSA